MAASHIQNLSVNIISNELRPPWLGSHTSLNIGYVFLRMYTAVKCEHGHFIGAYQLQPVRHDRGRPVIF